MDHTLGGIAISRNKTLDLIVPGILIIHVLLVSSIMAVVQFNFLGKYIQLNSLSFKLLENFKCNRLYIVMCPSIQNRYIMIQKYIIMNYVARIIMCIWTIGTTTMDSVEKQ